jgi:hypothetical protein
MHLGKKSPAALHKHLLNVIFDARLTALAKSPFNRPTFQSSRNNLAENNKSLRFQLRRFLVE